MYEQHEFVIRDHLLFCYHSSDFDNISILASSNNDFKVTFIETPLNSKEHLPFGKGKQTLSLDVLDDKGTEFYHAVVCCIDSIVAL